MTAKDCFELLVSQIHTTVAATVDEEGLPVTCVIDLMYADENGLYFITSKDKDFCKRLKKRPYAAFSGCMGKDPLHSTAVSVRGKVEELGQDMLPKLFALNPYMDEICPDDKSKEALTVFRLYEGTGEWYDLTKKPVDRGSFVFGQKQQTETAAPAAQTGGYVVTENCIGCGTCADACPNGCITLDGGSAVIQQDECLQCGCCADACPVSAIEQQ